MNKSRIQFEDSKILKDVFEGLAENTRQSYRVTLRQFLRFRASKEGLSKEEQTWIRSGQHLDEIVEELKSNVEEVQRNIDNFYHWLQNEEVDGYRKRGKTIKQSSAHAKAYSALVGLFVNLDVLFKRKWRKSIPKPQGGKALKKDDEYTFFEVDEKTRSIRFNRARMQQFLANLKFRDQAITLALLSSSQDSGDLFKLNISDVRHQTNNRIFWQGYRGKTGILFRTFFSKEATKFFRRYIQQERNGAGDEEPLFVTINKRMTPQNLSSIYRDAAKRMGIEWSNGQRNPLRPKRMRHLFRTACDTAGVNELYVNAFMGHKNSQGQDYSELSRATLELEYLKVEPFLTVYGEVEESLGIKEDVTRLEKRIVDLNRTISTMTEKFEQEIKRVESEFNQRLDDFFAEYEQPSSDVPLPEPTKEEILQAREKLSRKE